MRPGNSKTFKSMVLEGTEKRKLGALRLSVGMEIRFDGVWRSDIGSRGVIVKSYRRCSDVMAFGIVSRLK